MGLKEKIRRKKIYFDTNIFIYLFEGNKKAIPQIKLLQPLIEQGEITVVSSALVYASSLWYKLSEIRITGLIISPLKKL